jgi:hypothetical protein
MTTYGGERVSCERGVFVEVDEPTEPPTAACLAYRVACPGDLR